MINFSTNTHIKLLITIILAVIISNTSGCTGSTDIGNYDDTNSTGSTITLSWDPPTHNTDGSPMTDLSGYKIYYGTSSYEVSSNSITINNPSISTYVIDNLNTNTTYYFVITAINSRRIESRASAIVSKASI
ncbi:MAG: fibronectin type III domain-containing protein [Gammaproteobacteria bacterium]|nr:fibronectin type III domain-containing protein [Gammaproteobacteria bacterium]